MAKGIDYAFAPHPSVPAITGHGASFVCRYLSDIPVNFGNGKNLTLSERNALRAAGLGIVVVYETAANRALGDFNAGVADGHAAEAELAALGMQGMPVYFAADFDATEGQQGAINSYLDGAASVIGRGRTGLYAGYYPVKRAFDAAKITYGWQTYAWSGGQWDSRAQLRQVKNGVTVGGASCDDNESHDADFGQWPRPSSFPLREGMSDQDASGLIGILQRNINRWGSQLGASVQLAVDGAYGPVTAVAVGFAQVFFGERGQPQGVCTQSLYGMLAGAVPVKPLLPAPASLTQKVIVTRVQVNFAWTPVPDAVSYAFQLEWYKPQFGWILAASKSVGTTTDSEVLTPGTRYRWRVSSGTWSGWTTFVTP